MSGKRFKKLKQEEIEAMLIAGLIVLIIAGAILSPVIYGIYDSLYLEPMRAERASFTCKFQGYDTYDDYRIKLFSDVPYGLRCRNIQNKQHIDLTVNPMVAGGEIK